MAAARNSPVVIKTIEAGGPFGAIQPGFKFHVHTGYVALLGVNNSGKSTVLQWLYRDLMNDNAVGVEGVCYVEADRGFISPTTEVQGQSIGAYNSAVATTLSGTTTLQYNAPRSPFPGDMTKYLLNHKNFRHQLDRMDGLLSQLGLPPMVLQTSQTVYFEDVLAAYQGSGLRSLLPVLAAASDPAMRVILIDEPETSLEPQLATRLRRLLISSAGDRSIIVASHSHLFIDRDDISSTMVVSREDGATTLRAVKSRAELADLVFRLLGNSPDDLLLPANFLVVEGASDQSIAERVLEILGAPAGRVKVFSSRGLDNVPTAAAATETVRPLILGDGPYAKSVVVLVDQAVRANQRKRIDQLAAQMPGRVFELDQSTLEAYLPEAVYRRVRVEKDAVLREISRLKDHAVALGAYKSEVARKVAARLVRRDLERIPMIRDACQAALDLSSQ